MAVVFVPALLRELTGGRSQVSVGGASVREVVDKLEAEYPGLRARLVGGGALLPSLSVAVDGEVSPLGLMEKVGETSEVHFLTAISGGV